MFHHPESCFLAGSSKKSEVEEGVAWLCSILLAHI